MTDKSRRKKNRRKKKRDLEAEKVPNVKIGILSSFLNRLSSNEPTMLDKKFLQEDEDGSKTSTEKSSTRNIG